MLDTIGSVEHKSIHGLMHAVYALTAAEGNSEVSSGVRGGRMGSAREAVTVLVPDSPFLLSRARWSATSLKTLFLKWLLVMGDVAKLICGCECRQPACSP